MSDPVLELAKASKYFGGIKAVDGLSFAVGPGEIVGLIGPNGSGKSTTVNLIAGKLGLTSGRILLEGRAIDELSEDDRVHSGLTRTFQTATNFNGFTVREQVILGCHSQMKVPAFASIFRTRASRLEDAEQSARVAELLDLVGLSAVADDLVERLSSAEQRLLMIATALAAYPKVLLMDEPAAGMVASERKALGQLILAIRDRGISIVVIEHHMSLIMEVCDRIVVLNFGNKIAEGTPEQVRNNPAVIDAYLGETQ